MSHRHVHTSSSDPQETLIARARKHRRHGETRKMLTALREACLRDEGAAWLWTLYGAMLAANGRGDEAGKALRHALWLRRAEGDALRERTTRELIDRAGVPFAA